MQSAGVKVSQVSRNHIIEVQVRLTPCGTLTLSVLRTLRPARRERVREGWAARVPGHFPLQNCARSCGESSARPH